MLLEERGERVGVEERHVAVQHEHLAVEAVGERRERLLDGATGAGDLVLVDDDDAGHHRLDLGGDLVALVAHDRDDVRGVEGVRRASTCATIGAPARGCRSFGVADFMRVPWPAASTMMASFWSMLRHQDSNLVLTAPKAVVLPLHHGGPRRTGPDAPSSLPWRADASRHPAAPDRRDNGGMTDADEVDRIVGDWERERPDLDFAPLQVLSRVARLSKHLDRARRQAFARSELESSEFDVLSALRRAGTPYRLSPKQLLQQTLVSSGTMTNRIDRLVERGLVTRQTDPNDGRGILVEMSPAGLTRVDAAITRLVDAEAELLDGLPAAEQKRLAGLLRKLSLGFD